MKNKRLRQLGPVPVAIALLLLSVAEIQAQSGQAGITDATNQIRAYFNVAINLMYAIGALVGLIGAIKVYNKWNSGEPDTGRVAAAWFGSCIFLVLVASVIKSFFNV